MIKFLDGDAISAKIIQTIREADDYLLLISPFIKLNDKIKKELKYLVGQKPDVEIEVVFGKNDRNPVKSLSEEDLEFLKTLPNIRIGYVKELHAKIYCSEDRLMLSSMNLHEFSQAYNYEAAFVIEGRKTLIGSFVPISGDNAWEKALEFVNQIIEHSDTIFKRGKVYKSTWLGFSTEVVELINEDNSTAFFKKPEVKKIVTPIYATKVGYCIRTGVEIPFNLEKPFSLPAFKSWETFKNLDYKEKYCHFSGEKSDGQTSFKAPILRKNWKNAKIKFGF
ncbi:hypothetical protein EZJ43_11415 [Pedobacter changchengzhani]|uniref:Phospholipase D-like domain-containing protein n=1 Tax=Pedobacter changchengzhani TaxID=2529274 RepID=A0A4R5MK08_9SPHI|nr:phospholipase D-like domain-containing protein [Pedobacter changchengzhani]TDG35951.1 hypothetical protein EZJ43_11415 [Pedobacter changchengzhani]